MRKTIASLKPYKVKPEFGMIRLDNNEAFKSLLSEVDFSKLQKTLINRYPAESTEALEKAFGRFAGFPSENVLAGNGSDEWISLISQYVLEPGDRVLVLEPDFSMYEKNATIMGASVMTIPLPEDFSFPLEKVAEEIQRAKPSLMFLSNPNNPTGKLYEEQVLEEVISELRNVGGILVLDEAYMDFAGESPFARKVLEYDNLIILRTASKALGMAALRLGFLIACDRIIEEIGAIKPPYNVNTVSAQIGAELLEKPELLDGFLVAQLVQITELEDILKEFASANEGVELVPSSTNFFLMKMENPGALGDFLYERNIKIRVFDRAVRISAGTKEEHERLRAALKEWSESYAKSS